MKSQRIFDALGGVDPALIQRSERPRRRRVLPWAAAAAACLAVLCAAGLWSWRSSPGGIGRPSDEPQPVPLRVYADAAEIGELHLLQIPYGPEQQEAQAGAFILFLNEELYEGAWEDGSYVIRPNVDMGGLPVCDMTIRYLADTALNDAVQAQTQLLEETYASVLDASGDTPGPLAGSQAVLAASGGNTWDSPQARVWLVDDQQGGVYTLTARYFLEAEEGHGARFTDMACTFEALTPLVAPPDWMTTLRETVEDLLPALFSGEWSDGAGALLAADAQVDCYGENVLADVSVAGIDYAIAGVSIVGTDCTVDSDAAPPSVTVSVRHRVGTETGYVRLIMELDYADGQWLLRRAGMEP